MIQFRRPARSRFPADMIERLDLLGRYELDHSSSGIDGREIPDLLLLPFHQDAQDDPDGFLADLRAVVAGDTRGFPTYGASRLMFELVGTKRGTPDALALLDGGIRFKRERGLETMHLTGYEMSRWLEQNEPGTW